MLGSKSERLFHNTKDWTSATNWSGYELFFKEWFICWFVVVLGAWVAHTAAVRGDPVARPPSSSTVSSASITSTIPANERECLLAPGTLFALTLHFNQFFWHFFFNFHLDMDEPLTVNTPMATVVQAMQRPDSGLEIRDRMWLKITIPNAFIGTDMIDWLLSHVEGFQVCWFIWFCSKQIMLPNVY